ncbi:hypothetical protein LOAG_16501 [Loa loa]|uniref:TSC-22/dip/bun family protein n=1 Tax=Loa loa TaxID=7209 RepID=A0A1S0ULE9_LOALO|nr:hypothetical protein LOAG_16501 [Loa loa]EJD76552.1 hypothetical protein LOAG_16501 [Loa loa]
MPLPLRFFRSFVNCHYMAQQMAKLGSQNKSQELSSKYSISQNKTTKASLKNDADSQNKTRSNVMETELALGGRMTPVEMLNSLGLEGSLTATYNDNRSILELLPGTIQPTRNLIIRPGKHIDCEKVESSPAGETVVAASGTGASTPIIAIDGKIEQAMDLVKTHLMFAVREEVDVLRAKIMELEATILQLETENAILREHVPVEILNKLSLQSTPPNSSTTTTAV